MLNTIDARNVHQAIPEGCRQVQERGTVRGSRNGPVMQLPGPLVTTYRRPCERVEFHEERDANPFFHLMESLWMLAGRNDVEFVSRYSAQIGRYSDDGTTINGAYGHRWRSWFGLDQLNRIAVALRANNQDRRQVLAMWDGARDLANVSSKDVPCNTTAYLQVNPAGLLDLMVCNRSNDLIWGAYGANAVHFSVLLEYMAMLVGVPVGSYYQVSMNTHVYQHHWELMKVLAAKAEETPATRVVGVCPYSTDEAQPYPLISVDTPFGQWDAELHAFLRGAVTSVEDPFFRRIALPMSAAWDEFKDKQNPDRHQAALATLTLMPVGNDWRLACERWITRRMEKALAAS